MVDGFRQTFGKLVGDFALIDAEGRGQLRQRATAAQRLGDLFARDGQVLTIADPRADLVTQAGLFQDLLQRAEAARRGCIHGGVIGVATARQLAEQATETAQRASTTEHAGQRTERAQQATALIALCGGITGRGVAVLHRQIGQQAGCQQDLLVAQQGGLPVASAVASQAAENRIE
jgi:hypothetical protein